jgi:hypothetical protein
VWFGRNAHGDLDRLRLNGVKAFKEAQRKKGMANVIQRYWKQSFRFKTAFKLVKEFFSTGPTIDHVKSIR